MPDPILMVTGPPGSGKTTTARLPARKSARAVHLESDSFFHFIRGGYVEPWKPESREQNTTVMRIVADAAAGYAGGGYFTIIDGIISPRWFFEPARDALHQAGHEVAYAVLLVPVDVCVARARSRDRDRLADATVVEQLWGDFAELGSLERHAIHTEDQSAAEVAGQIAERLKEGLLTV